MSMTHANTKHHIVNHLVSDELVRAVRFRSPSVANSDADADAEVHSPWSTFSGECTGTSDDTKRFTCGEKEGKCDGEYFHPKAPTVDHSEIAIMRCRRPCCWTPIRHPNTRQVQ